MASDGGTDDRGIFLQGVTAELLKDIITIFYTPLAQVYKAASIADSLGDMQAFINDMIRTVEQVEERESFFFAALLQSYEEFVLIPPLCISIVSQEDPQRTVQTFIDLVQRHEQSFYTFVHNVHSKGKGLFDSLMSWLELFLNYARSGLPSPIDLEFILPHSQEERRKVLAEVDNVAMYHYQLKVAHEEKIRRRFRAAAADNGGVGGIGDPIDDEAELLSSVMASLNIGETTMDEAGDLADEESEEEAEDEEEEEEERELANLEEGDEEKSETSSMNLASPKQETLSPPSGGAGTGNSTADRRRSSHSSTSQSLKKVRSALKFRHGDDKKSSPTAVAGGTGEGRQSSPLAQGRHHVHGHGNGRKRKKGGIETLAAPETNAIATLRPLFVEAVSDLYLLLL